MVFCSFNDSLCNAKCHSLHRANILQCQDVSYFLALHTYAAHQPFPNYPTNSCLPAFARPRLSTRSTALRLSTSASSNWKVHSNTQSPSPSSPFISKRNLK
jgi:hypothetical protein